MRNEALTKLDGLVGDWKLTMTDAWFLDSPDVRVEGSATIEWLGDAFLMLRSIFDGKPDWEWVIGRSDSHERYVVLYHDNRGVCRVFDMTFGDGDWRMERYDPDFHQRLIATVEPDRILSRFEASEDEGRTWRKDFDMIFERKQADSA
jgi:hypothetical protein